MQKIFDLWVEPRLFSQWLDPKGNRMEYIDDVIAEGKTTFIKMTYDSGLVMHGKIHYEKIERPQCLEYTHIFCDENGNLSKHPDVPVWPPQLRTRVLLTEEEDNQSRITLIWQP